MQPAGRHAILRAWVPGIGVSDLLERALADAGVEDAADRPNA